LAIAEDTRAIDFKKQLTRGVKANKRGTETKERKISHLMSL
jgi:hypothetical protein